VPSQDGFGLYHLDRVNKARPKPDHPNAGSLITAVRSQPGKRPPHRDIQLMSEKQILGLKPAPRLEQVGDEHPKRVQERKHRFS
jgi:hypothetical protein